MREIKFRGKRLDNGEWVYGGYVKEHRDKFGKDIKVSTNSHLIFVNEFGAINAGFKPRREDYSLHCYEVIPESVGQYVEILDAYEGDLLLGYEKDEYGTLLSSWVGVIKYNDEKSRIMILEEELQEWYEVDDYIFDRIIGNIYEHRYLLEVK